MSEQNWTAQEIELAKVLRAAFCAHYDYVPEKPMSDTFLLEARAAIAHLAAKPPAMTEERRKEIIDALYRHGYHYYQSCVHRDNPPTSTDIEEWAVKNRLIPARPAPTIGELLKAKLEKMKTVLLPSEVENCFCLEVGKIFDPAIELAKAAKETYPELADAALATIEALKGKP